MTVGFGSIEAIVIHLLRKEASPVDPYALYGLCSVFVPVRNNGRRIPSHHRYLLTVIVDTLSPLAPSPPYWLPPRWRDKSN
ncbi:unnamed protein product, partial [Iphiclides podalirius]